MPIVIALLLAASHPPGLTTRQLSQLRGSHLHCVVAGYVSPGYTGSLEIYKPSKSETGGYCITYAKGKSEFIVEMLSDGIGDADIVDEPNCKFTYQMLRTALLGSTQVEFVVDNEGRHHFDISWKDFGPKKVPRFLCVIGHLMPNTEGIKILKHLKWLPGTKKARVATLASLNLERQRLGITNKN